jgi:glycosyltransferase involved in cell wall biosynthesis
LKISVVHSYLENRLNESNYPSQHKWASDAVIEHLSWEAKLLPTSKFKIPQKFEFFLNKTVFRGSPGSKVELSAWKAARISDLIYSISGPLALAHLYPKKLLSWVFTEPPALGRGFKLAHRAYKSYNLRSNAGFLCLTPKAEEYYSQFAPSKFIPWCVDLGLFDGAPPKKLPKKPFFLATGKTYRDYATLVKAAKNVAAEIRIIGPSIQKPRVLPPNVNWIDTSSTPPDQAIDYPTLREWYAQCIAVCIPLSGDADDTCGYTNMLEAMAMRKPVLMTQSGCLHINPEIGGFGRQMKPRDAQGWVQEMNHLHEDHEKALEMGNRGREIVERDFTIERFNQDVLGFIESILNKS